MKKLKKFNLNCNKVLTSDEMEALCGGEFLSFYCYYEYQRCFILKTGGGNTGTCRLVDKSMTEKGLDCVVDV